MTNDSKNYWQDRVIQPSTFARLKSIAPIRWAFSVRSTDERFIQDYVERHPGNYRILDLACGRGQELLVRVSEAVTGVDIQGFPAEAALTLGYNEVLTWDENYEFRSTKRFNLVTAINLNAHVSFEQFSSILTSARRFLDRDAVILLVNEYNNDNLLFRRMKRDKSKFDAYVRRTEHWHFEYEREFVPKMAKFDWLTLEETRVLAPNPPMLHYRYALGEKESTGLPRQLSNLCWDFAISALNNLSRAETGFVVGHVYRQRNVST